MSIVPFSPEYASAAKSFVIDVLACEGFEYDPLKDSDLDDIGRIYSEKGGAFFLYLHDGSVVGTSAVKGLGSSVCEIKRLYVKNECRGKGVGSAMFGKALEHAKKNFSCIRLKTDHTLERAISIYLNNGFRIVKEENGVIYFEKVL